MSVDYYFCTAVPLVAGGVDMLNTTSPLVKDAITKCCAEVSGTIGVGTYDTDKMFDSNPLKTAPGLMGCGWAKPPDYNKTLDPDTEWGFCAMELQADAVCFSEWGDPGNNPLVSAKPFEGDSAVAPSAVTAGSGGSPATSAAAGTTSKAAGSTKTSGCVAPSSAGLGIGRIAFLVGSLALAIVGTAV